MAETKIEWAATVRPDGTTVPGYTFNPWRGCTKVSDGCRSCYADTMSKRNPGTLGVWGPMGTRVVAAESYWRLPEKWNRDASFVVDLGEPRPRVFCASLADVFEDWQGPMTGTDGRYGFQSVGCSEWVWSDLAVTNQEDEYRPLTMDHVRARLFRLIDATPNLDWLLLTKRPENIVRMMPERSPRRQCPAGVSDVYRPNVWLGTSVENQATADERIPHLLRVPAAVRFLSLEPLLGPVDLSRFHIGWSRCPACQQAADPSTENPLGSEIYCRGCEHDEPLPVDGRHLHWVIVGGESGPNARPMHPNWVRSIRDQCQAAGVPFHFKQWGAFEPVTPLYRGRDDTLETGGEVVVNSDGTIHNDRDGQPNDPHAWLMHRVGKKSAGRLLDGRTWDEVPDVSRG